MSLAVKRYVSWLPPTTLPIHAINIKPNCTKLNLSGSPVSRSSSPHYTPPPSPPQPSKTAASRSFYAIIIYPLELHLRRQFQLAPPNHSLPPALHRYTSSPSHQLSRDAVVIASSSLTPLCRHHPRSTTTTSLLIGISSLATSVSAIFNAAILHRRRFCKFKLVSSTAASFRHPAHFLVCPPTDLHTIPTWVTHRRKRAAVARDIRPNTPSLLPETDV